jgi:phosphomannomutase
VQTKTKDFIIHPCFAIVTTWAGYAKNCFSAGAEDKYKAAKVNSHKRIVLRDVIASRLPEFEVRTGGTTTIDITRKGIDKAYGIQQLMNHLNLINSDILFVGDKLEVDGNDYPVKAFGIDSIAVKNHEDTERLLQAIITSKA